jgi:hypothetical protein
MKGTSNQAPFCSVECANGFQQGAIKMRTHLL